MGTFLRLETCSNILGSKDMDVTYISLSQIDQVRSNSSGGSTVVLSNGECISVTDYPPDFLMENCIHTVSK